MTGSTSTGFFVAAVAGAWLATGHAVAAEDCPGAADIAYDIDLHIDTPPARLHHDRSIAQLGQMAVHGRHARVLGLANTGLDFGWRVRFESVPSGDAVCFWVSRVELTVGHPSPDIYIAREYRRGSCPYRTILAHEERHARTSRALINRYLPRLRWVLTSLRIPTGRRPLRVTSHEQAEAKVRALMRDLAEPLYREMAAALARAQTELDSPASYRSLFRRCRNW